MNSQQPTVAERGGDFSAFLVNGGCAPGSGGTCIYDPSTGLPFQGNIIQPGRFNSVDTQLLNILYPLPTQAGLGTNTFQLVPYTSEATRISVRLDHQINDRNQIRATYLRAFYGPNPDVGTSSLAGGSLATESTIATSSLAGPRPFPRPFSLIPMPLTFICRSIAHRKTPTWTSRRSFQDLVHS